MNGICRSWEAIVMDWQRVRDVMGEFVWSCAFEVGGLAVVVWLIVVAFARRVHFLAVSKIMAGEV